MLKSEECSQPVDPVKREEKVKKAIQKAFEFYDMNHSGNIEYLELVSSSPLLLLLLLLLSQPMD